MSYKDTLNYIHKTSWLGSKPGLSRTFTLLEKVGRPDKKLKFVHIAGTNGKGSVSACIASVLMQSGYKTGLYTSPYINSFNERFRINGKDISNAELTQIVDEVRPFADAMTDDPPTEFELITVIAFMYFAKNNCDIVVLEAGMGGLLDSTNVIDAPECAVLCNIGLDHTAFLGSTVEEIAKTKGGIIKHGSDVVMYDADTGVYEVIKNICAKKGCALYTADFSRLRNINCSLEKTTFDYADFTGLTTSLLGIYQPFNASLAIKCALVLRERGFDISDNNIRDGIAKTSWLGRFELLGKKPYFILDGSHNPQGLCATVNSFKEYFPNNKIKILLGVMADKDVGEMLTILSPVAESFIAVTPDNPRALDCNVLCTRLRELGAKATSANSVYDGVKLLLESACDSDICACLGSLYFSGDVRRAYNALTDKNS